MDSSIYLDNGATTRTSPRVVEAMVPYFLTHYGNPSSGHPLGKRSHRALEEARKIVLSTVGAPSGHVIFTSGGTEANALGLRSALRGRKGNVVVGSLEHSSLLKHRVWAEAKGHEWRVVPVGKDGRVIPKDLMKVVDRDTRIVVLMLANNEIGTLQPIAEVGAMLSRFEGKPRFHVDAVQGFTKTRLDMIGMHIDTVSLSAHKIHGPPGVGALVCAGTGAIVPLFEGGGQENGHRPGTENVPGVVGFAEAIREVMEAGEEPLKKMAQLRDHLISEILERIPDSSLNGHARERLCNNANLAFEGVAARAVLPLLESRGVYASAGSACHAGKKEQSEVLKALGVPLTSGALRFTLSRDTTLSDVDFCVEVLAWAIGEAKNHQVGVPLL